MDSDVNTTELWVHHQAMPVLKGVKFAVNYWIYMYDYQTPRTIRRCADESFAEHVESPCLEPCRRLEGRPKERCELLLQARKDQLQGDVRGWVTAKAKRRDRKGKGRKRRK